MLFALTNIITIQLINSEIEFINYYLHSLEGISYRPETLHKNT